MVSQTPDTNVLMAVVSIHPGECFSRRPLFGHSSADGPFMDNTVLKLYEQQEFQEKQSNYDEYGKSLTKLKSFQKYAKVTLEEKLHEYMPCANYCSNYTKNITILEKPDVKSFIILSDDQIGKRHHRKKRVQPDNAKQPS